MGKHHCILSGCAEVRYQPYEYIGGVRYRYPGQDWVTVDGDDFELDDNRLGQCEETYYVIEYKYNVLGIFATAPSSQYYVRQKGVGIAVIIDPISEEIDTADSGQTYTYPDGSTKTVNRRIAAVKYKVRYPDGSIYEGVQALDNGFGASAAPGTITTKISRLDGKPDDCGDCTFTIFKEGVVVRQQTRDDCPEVEILESDEGSNCQLSDRTKIVKIDKFPLIERIDVVDHAYQNIGRSVQKAPIPDNCLNIYKPTTPTITPIFDDRPNLSNSSIDQDFSYGFVEQICSSEGCPPPQYEVICSCEGEECPPDTCPVECGSTVCCYDTNNGQAVDEIPLENYKGGGI